MFKTTEELDEYISLITLDFMKSIYRNRSRIYGGDKRIILVEQERQINTKIGIIALLKLYKNLPLSVREQELIVKYPLENDYRTELERCIAYIAFEIGKEAWDRVNNIRLEMEGYEYQHNNYTYLEIDNHGNVTHDSQKRAYYIKVFPSDACLDYLELLDEYISDLRHAWAYHHGISLITPGRDRIKPSIDFDSEIFIKAEKSSLIRKLIKFKQQ